MGLFNFFKKKTAEAGPYLNPDPNEGNEETTIRPKQPEPENTAARNIAANDEAAPQDLFNFIYKYGEYVVVFLNMMFQGNHSPIAAYEKPDGELIGYLFMAEDMSYNLSVKQVIEKMEVEFEKLMTESLIVSWVIFYHSEFNDDNNHRIAGASSKIRAITAKYKSENSAGYLGFPYTQIDDSVEFKGFSGFSREQNAQILSAKIISGKDYFQERVKIEPEIHTNEAGIIIKTVNNGSLGNMWRGILGFEKFNEQLLREYMAYIFIKENLKRSNANASIYELNYGDVVFRGIKQADDSWRTFLPSVKSENPIDVVNKQINVWENADFLEAVISGGGRDTFGVTYFATDYAENKAIYHSARNLDIAFSAILFVLDEINKHERLPDGTEYADGFAAYMPHKELAEFGCYDFMGILEDFYENKVLDDGRIDGYILKVRLINNPEARGFFTIPMFVNTNQIRFKHLKKGMKIGGSFQLLGEIKQR